MEFSEITKKYWEDRDWEDVEKAESVEDLYVVAQRIIDRMLRPIVEVCGPIANGGLGSLEANIFELRNLQQGFSTGICKNLKSS